MSDRDTALQMIREHERFLITCHRRPDADALGSALGFAEVLDGLGKDVTVFVPDALPLTLRFLVGPREMLKEIPANAEPFAATFVMDTAAESLLPDGLPPLAQSGPRIVVDHHAAHDDVGDLKVRDTSACATGEIIAELAKELGIWPLNAAGATALYSAIVADTGGFRYPMTKPRTLRLGAELLEAGADPWDVAYELFEGWTKPRLLLLSSILDTLEMHCGGRMALLRVTRTMLEEVGANDDMVEGMVNYGRMLRGVEIAALVWEWPAKGGGLDTKVSLRSRGEADISEVAVALGGGGHRNAAGAQLPCDIDETARRVVIEAASILDHVATARARALG